MITYYYKCHNSECGAEQEVLQSIKDDALTVCPVCSLNTFQRELFPFSLTVKAEATTLGQVMDRNTMSMGKYEKQDKDAKIREGKIRPEWSGKATTSVNPINKKYDGGMDKQVSYQKINAMTPKQKERYIVEGKV